MRVSGNLGNALPSSILTSRTTMVFSLNCSLSRFYRGIIQSSSDLLYPHVYCRLRRSRWLSCTSPRITGSSSIPRWSLTRAPICDPTYLPPDSSLCPRCVLEGSSRSHQVLSQHRRALVIPYPLFVNHAPNALPVSSLYLRRITNVSSQSCQTIVRTSPLCCHSFIAVSSRPPSTLPNRYQSCLQSQLKRCQDTAKQSLVCCRFLVNASRPRSLRIIHSMSVPLPNHCRRVPSTLSLLFAVSPVPLQYLVKAYPQLTTTVFSSTMKARSSPRQYVTDSSSKRPLVLGILSKLAKTLPGYCHSTVRESCFIKSFSTRHQVISDELPVLSLSRPRSSTSTVRMPCPPIIFFFLHTPSSLVPNHS